MSCFAAILLGFWLMVWLIDYSEDVVGAHDLKLLAIQLNFRAAVLADEDAVALLDFERDFLPVIIGLARAEGDDDALLGLFLGGIGDDDAALLGFLLFGRLNEETVSEGFDVQCHSLVCLVWLFGGNQIPPPERTGKFLGSNANRVFKPLFHVRF